MKRKLLFSLTAVALVAITFGSYRTISNPSGAPAGVANDPLSGSLTCTDCHSGNASTVSGWITSNIPAAGYTPGQTYTITGTCTSAGKVRFGFEMSPQNSAGTKLGTLIITSASTTKLVGSNKYITHTTSGNSGTSPKAWSFNWTAPAAGVGPVTFYGAFMGSNNNTTTSGDITYRTSTIFHEAVASGISEIKANTSDLNVINLGGSLHLSYTAKYTDNSNVELYDIKGSLVSREAFGKQSAGNISLEMTLSNSMKSGVYIVKVIQGSEVLTKKTLLTF